MNVRRCLVAAIAVVIAWSGAYGQPCRDHLVRSYGLGSLIGGIDCAAAFDDGAGASLFAAGPLRVGSQNASLVKLVGGRWVRDAAISGNVTCMAVLDDGTGASLYIGGVFTVSPSTDTVHVARWNGAGWTAYPPISLLGGIGPTTPLRCLAWHNDGSGGKLYVGGSLFRPGTGGGSCLARWDGQAWSGLIFAPVGTVNVRTMLPYDDGTGLKLYIGGNLTSAGGVAVTGLATWDGASWAAVGPGFASGSSPSDVYSLAVHNDGSGQGLYAAGVINLPDRHNGTSPVAVWRNGTWSRVLAIGSDLTNPGGASAITSLDDGSGPALYAATGDLAERCTQVRKFQNGAWTNVGPMFEVPGSQSSFDGVRGLLRVPGSSRLGAFGHIEFNAANLMEVADMPPLAVWNGGGWFSPEAGALGVQRVANVVADPEDPQGRVYAQGEVLVGGTWSVASPPFPANGLVHAPHNGVDATFTWSVNAIWVNTGAGWQSFPAPSIGIRKLVGADDGGGRALFALLSGTWPNGNGGTASGVRVQKWNGSAWTDVGPALVGAPSLSSLAFYDDGSGPRAYIGGRFGSLGSNPSAYLAALVGGQWVAVDGLIGNVNDLLVFDVGAGPELIIAGDFAASAMTSNGVARWNGSRLWGLGTGMGGAGARGTILRALDDGRGRRLWAASVSGDGLMCWDGAGWVPPVSLIAPWFTSVTSLAEVNRADGSHSLFIGGTFTMVNGVSCNNIAELALCRATCTADFDGDGVAATDQDIEAFFACLAGSCCATCESVDFNNDGDTATDADIESFFRVLAGGGC